MQAAAERALEETEISHERVVQAIGVRAGSDAPDQLRTRDD
jgi:hypothetical protein